MHSYHGLDALKGYGVSVIVFHDISVSIFLDLTAH